MEINKFAEDLVKSIVKEPDMVKVQQFGSSDSDDDSITLEIIVHESDMGAVIGKGGKMATSIRTIIQAYAYIHNMNKVRINIDSF